MCGIAGIYYFKKNALAKAPDHARILNLLRHRGPDQQSVKQFDKAVLYHSRLTIVDTSDASNQPFLSDDEHEAMVFNGEIFNYRDLQKQLSGLRTSGDVEVLFRELKAKGKEGLNTLNGFFAFGYYDAKQHALLVGRDRFGVKPLYYYHDEEKLVFASELKPLLELTGPLELNHDQVYTYFRFNYCSGPETIFKNVHRLLPGQCLEVSGNRCEASTWYKAPRKGGHGDLYTLLDDAVRLRLQADVPVGTFLSGGLDSSIISALAIRHKPDLNTFSIGFADAGYFDETEFANRVAKHIGSNHHVYKLKEDDFLDHITSFLASIDEPFADSSAFNFYLLSLYTRKKVKVALSGDGADELFKGYNKHRALMLSNERSKRMVAKITSAALSLTTQSRDGYVNNKVRQLKKFTKLAKLSGVEKQKFLATISGDEDCRALLKNPTGQSYFDRLFKSSDSLQLFELDDSFDIQTVLTDDMLVKADRFSMQQGIEIRNPFLDYRVVEFALNLPYHDKISKNGQKLILKQSFGKLLPQEILTRSKKGFELPLQRWLATSLHATVDKWLSRERIAGEGLLNYNRVDELKQQVFSANAGDSAAKLWAVLIFESWLHNFKDHIKH